MQDNYQDFDLRLRSMLEDAEVRPPRGTWKGISRRLDAAVVPESPATRSGIMRWAGAALALAAVAIGVFIALPDPAINPQGPVRGALTAENTRIITPDIEEATALGAFHKRTSYEDPGADITSVSVQEAESFSKSIDSPEKPDAGRSSNAGNSEKSAPRSNEYGQPGNDTTDPFALLAAQDSQAGRQGLGKTFLYAKGAIGGNDPDFVSRNAGISMAPGTSSSGITELSESTYGIPLTLGLGIRLYLLPKLSVGTGIDYSLLTRTFTGTYTGPGDSGETQVTEAGNVQHTMQYVGIPLDLYYDILVSDKMKFYVYGGGEAEYCVSNNYTVFSSPQITCSEPVRKFQYSVGGGVGVEFRLAPNLGLYLDPGVKYYFPGGQPKSIRTDKPFMFNFDAGLRFSL